MAAGGGKLIDLLVNESGVLQLLAKNGIEGTVAKEVQSYVASSILSLGAANRSLSPDELMKIIKGLSDTPADRKVKKSLLTLLNKNADELDKAEVTEAINNLIFLANRHGVRGSLVLACSECVSNSLFSHGFRFTFNEVKNDAIKQVLETIPRDPRELSQFISNRMRRVGAGKFDRSTKNLVGAEEEKALAIFLALADANSPANRAQKDFIKSVLEVSTTPSGEVKLLDPENPHKFWRTFDDPSLTDKDLVGWTSLLKKTSEEGKSSVSKKEAFYNVLERSAGDSQELSEQVNALRVKNCFFGR